MTRYRPKTDLKTWRNISLGVGAFLLILIAIIYLGFFSQPEKSTARNMTVEGLLNDVEILTGNGFVPRITASNLSDLFRTIGYLQASGHLKRLDRLLRVATGQMAEAYGKKYVYLDIAAHRLGFLDRAEQILTQLTPETKAIFEAYCGGINAFIVGRRHAVAQSFHLAGYQPLNWNPAGCLAILNYYQWTYLSRWDEKIILYKTLEVFGQERVVNGFPLLDQWSSPEQEYQNAFFTSLNELYRDGIILLQATPFIPDRNEILTWAVADEDMSPEQTRLIFENDWFDPEEFTFDMSIPEWRFSGIFFPGTPICLAESNRSLAWGSNWPDDFTVDFLAVKIAPNLKKYETIDGRQNLRQRAVTIKVKKGHRQTSTFYNTDQGVILDYQLHGTDSISDAIVLKWPGLTATEIEKRVILMLARDLDDFQEIISQDRAALARLVYFADNGDFGIIPESPEEPSNPEPGCLTSFRMKAFPVINKTDSDIRDGLIFPVWESGRSGFADRHSLAKTTFPERIDQGFTVLNTDKYFNRILKDIHAAISDTIFRRETEFLAFQKLINWDGTYAADEVGATVFQAFIRTMLKNVYGDELDLVDPEAFKQFVNANDFALQNLLLLTRQGESNWFDDLRTPDIVEWQGAIMRQSFRETVEFLEKQYSSNISEWQWGLVSRDFLNDEVSHNRYRSPRLNPVRSLVLNAAGSETPGYIIPANAMANPNEHITLFQDRFVLLRNGANILTLEAGPEKARE